MDFSKIADSITLCLVRKEHSLCRLAMRCRNIRFRLSAQLASVFALLLTLTAIAQDPVNFKDQIDAAEKQLNGQVSADGDLQSRLSKIEQTLFGETQKGALSDRMARVMTAVGL